MGADVVIGSSQRFGVPMGFGGPHAAFFATRDEYKRSMPGRVIGVSIDSSGRQALRMAMQTREQHIRREKATSNICTAQALLAIMAGLYAMHHGPEGLRAIASRVHQFTSQLATSISASEHRVVNESWFDTLTIKVECADTLLAKAEAAGFNLRRIDDKHVGVALDETTTEDELVLLIEVFGGNTDLSGDDTSSPIAPTLRREMDYLQHPLFHDYRTETEMLRYLKRLENKDISLTRAMIPLGSFTMKLNAEAEMMPVCLPEFARMHLSRLHTKQVAISLCWKNYRVVNRVYWLRRYVAPTKLGRAGRIRGPHGDSALPPARGESHRHICLIPTSAHGTNPASAVMAGMKVVLVSCDENGNVDMQDLKEKVATHSSDLARSW